MNFDAEDESPELRDFRAEVSAWLGEQLAGTQDLRWSATWSTRDNDVEYSFRRELGRRLGAKGWFFPSFPREYGGAGLTGAHHLVVAQEFDRRGLSLRMVYYTLASVVAPCILLWADDEQKRAFLPPLVRAEVSVWQLLTEPQGGSDPANCRTFAVRDGDRYIVNGQKVMVGSSHRPDYLWTLVCTDPVGARHKNLSWLYIPADTPGITILPMPMMMGRKNSVFFDDVSVPVFHRVGAENDGWSVGQTHLELEHGGSGGIDGGENGSVVARRLHEACMTVMPNGRRRIEDPNVRAILADALIEAHAVRLLGLRNAWFARNGNPIPHGGAQYRYFVRLARLNSARRVLEILGREALIEDLSQHEVEDFEHMIKSGPGQLHGGGTLDTDRLIIARRLGLGRTSRELTPPTA